MEVLNHPPSFLIELEAVLERLRADCDVKAIRKEDPVDFVHGYEEPEDREIVALVAACVAFGNVGVICDKLEEALAAFERVDPSPARAADDPHGLLVALRGWRHRVFRGEDLARLAIGARAVQREHRSLGALFERLVAERSLQEALAIWCDAIRKAGRLDRKTGSRGPSHLLPDPLKGSGSKRLLLFLRWMIRPADGVDLGLWRVSPGLLLCPVDVHVLRAGQNLGFTRRKHASWPTTEEITAGFGRIAPQDPTRYDFSLCHAMMMQRCPSARDAQRCEGCPIKPFCRHWDVRGDREHGR